MENMGKKYHTKGVTNYFHRGVSDAPIELLFVDGVPYYSERSICEFFRLSHKYRDIYDKMGLIVDLESDRAWSACDIGAPKSNGDRYIHVVKDNFIDKIGLNKKRRLGAEWFSRYVKNNARKRYAQGTGKEWHVEKSDLLKKYPICSVVNHKYMNAPKVLTTEIDGKMWFILNSAINKTGIKNSTIRKYTNEEDVMKIIIRWRDSLRLVKAVNIRGMLSIIESSQSAKTSVFGDWFKKEFANIIREEEKHNRPVTEGKIRQVIMTVRERNPAARKKCLAANGYSCRVCGFDFSETYGELGEGYIHVHHIETVASHDDEYEIDPAKDLIPVCPNCHAMLHKTDPPMHPDELRKVITESRQYARSA